MKNKKFTIGLVLLVAGSMAFTSCTKGKTNTEPTMDTEIATSKDRVIMEMIASDMGEVVAQGADGGTTIFSGTVFPTNGFPNRNITFTTNTMGWDGHTRTGSFQLNESSSYPGSTDYRMPGYVATCTVTGFVIDNYTVTVNSFSVVNTTSTGWTLGKDLTWKHSYDFSVTKPNGDVMTYQGTHNKILSGYPYGTSTNTTAVVTGTAGVSNTIIWQKATKVGFYGSASGMIAGQTYTSNVTKEKMLIRDYTCAPEKTSPPTILSRNERHPFINGIMTFMLTGSGKNERVIDFGETSHCDYNVKVLIDGITYEQDVNW